MTGIGHAIPAIESRLSLWGRRSTFSKADIQIEGLQWSGMYFGVAVRGFVSSNPSFVEQPARRPTLHGALTQSSQRQLARNPEGEQPLGY
jgi:hypothetical protein